MRPQNRGHKTRQDHNSRPHNQAHKLARKMRAQNEPTNSPHKVQNREKYSQTSKCPKWSPGKISRKTWSQTREGPKMVFEGVPRETCSQTTKLARKWSPGEIPRERCSQTSRVAKMVPEGVSGSRTLPVSILQSRKPAFLLLTT